MRPEALLSGVDDYVYVPGPRQAERGAPSEHGAPTSLHACGQPRGHARVVDDPARKAALPDRRIGHFQPEGGSARAATGEAPYGGLLSGTRGIRLEVTLEVTGVRAKSEDTGKRGTGRYGSASRPARRTGAAHVPRRHARAC